MSTSRRPVGTAGHRTNRQGGQALVEFALLVPVLLVLTIGIVDMARMASAYIALKDAVRQAALYAATTDTVKKWCDGTVGPDYVTCPTHYPTPGSASADPSTKHSADPDNIARVLVPISGTTLDASRLEMRAPKCGVDCASGDLVEIEAFYNFPLLTPVLPELVGIQGITLEASTWAAIK